VPIVLSPRSGRDRKRRPRCAKLTMPSGRHSRRGASRPPRASPSTPFASGSIQWFGRGETKLQPVYVEDVAEGIERVLAGGGGSAASYEFGGARVYTYKELVRTVADRIKVRPRLVPLPFALWRILASGAEFLPHPQPASRRCRWRIPVSPEAHSFSKPSRKGHSKASPGNARRINKRRYPSFQARRPNLTASVIGDS
jgi:hypothetical protein